MESSISVKDFLKRDDAKFKLLSLSLSLSLAARGEFIDKFHIKISLNGESIDGER